MRGAARFDLAAEVVLLAERAGFEPAVGY